MQNTNKETTRLLIFDLLRIVLIILVVNVHIRIVTFIKPNILEPLVWYAVPLYLVLSFYLMGKYFLQNQLNYRIVLPRLKRLFIPFLFWSCAGFFVHYELISLKNIFLQIITGEVVNVPLYYLVLLLIFSCIYWLLTYLPLRLRIIIYLLLIIIPLYLQYTGLNYNWFHEMSKVFRNSYGRFFELLPYASVGVLFRYIEIIKTRYNGSFLLKRFFRLIYIGLIVFSAAAYLLQVYVKQPSGFHYSGFLILSGTILIFSLVLLFPYVKTTELIAKLGRYSFGIYLFHFVLLEFIIRLFPYLKYFISDYSIAFLTVYVIICYFICILLVKFSKSKLSFLVE